MIPYLSTINSEQNAPTKNTMKRLKKLLDYDASKEETIVTFNASDMVLAIHSDEYYLSGKNAHSRVGGHHFLSSDKYTPPKNGAILNLSKIIRNVMSSAAEAELGALFLNTKTAAPMLKTLKVLCHL